MMSGTSGLVLFGGHLLLLGYLAYQSGFVPKLLAILIAIAGAGYVIDSFGSLLSGSYTVELSTFTFIGEALLIIWLLVKGRRLSPPTSDHRQQPSLEIPIHP